MKREEVAYMLNDIDEELLLRADEEVAVHARTRRRHTRGQWIRWGAMAACLCLVMCAVAMPHIWRDPVVVPPADTQAPPTGTPLLPPPITPPTQPQSPTVPADKDAGWVVIGDDITGKSDVAVELEGLWDDESGVAAELRAPWFYIRTVVEAKVVEVLPDVYHSYWEGTDFRIVKLEILDEVRGEGFPREIWYQFPARYEVDLLDGYDSMILSVRQIGIEHYMLINRTQGRVEYFSDMFATYEVNDPVYGSVIPFKDGVVVDDLWQETPYPYLTETDLLMFRNLLDKEGYPATCGSTVEAVKANIKAMESEMLWYNSQIPHDYVTADDVFVSEETRAVQAYVAPRQGNTFCQVMSIGMESVTASYIRLINGCGTEERIDVNDVRVGVGKVLYSDVRYTDDVLSRVPDIGTKIPSMELAEMIPPHIAVDEDAMELRRVTVSGCYRYVEGRIYGVIRIVWTYDYDPLDGTMMHGEVKDDCYYLCDDQGDMAIVERDELTEIIGDDPIVYHFSYEPYFYAY